MWGGRGGKVYSKMSLVQSNLHPCIKQNEAPAPPQDRTAWLLAVGLIILQILDITYSSDLKTHPA